ncbi:hypothetical protein H8958_017206 [Nasalis larvatus]
MQVQACSCLCALRTALNLSEPQLLLLINSDNGISFTGESRQGLNKAASVKCVLPTAKCHTMTKNHSSEENITFPRLFRQLTLELLIQGMWLGKCTLM